MDADWTSAATETRECFPYRSLHDLEIHPAVEWAWRQTPEDDWITVDGDHLIPPDRYERSTTIRARLLVDETMIAAIEDHLPGLRLGVGLTAQSSKSRGRVSAWTDEFGVVGLELTFRPSTWRGAVELRLVVHVVELGGNDIADQVLPDRTASPVWWSPLFRLILDDSPTASGDGFDVVWKDDLPPNQLFRLEPRAGEGELQPQLQLNGSNARIAAVWNATGTAGRKARIRDFLNALVSTDVMTDLALLADDVDESQSSQHDVEFKQKVQAALRSRFRIPTHLLTRIANDDEARRELHGLIQGSPPVRMVERIAKLVDEVDR